MMQFEHHRKVQEIAKWVHSQLEQFITSDSSEASIAKKATDLLADCGVTETWYYDVPAFVLLGSRSCLSVSGKNYVPSTEPVGSFNLVTVDLSPIIGEAWGDCARSYVVEEGIVTHNPSRTDFAEGLVIEKRLHMEMIEFAEPSTRFSDLFEYSNSRIAQYGYENIDFLLNLGHSIEVRPSERRFIDKNCHELLGSVSFFTFEPHIRKAGGKWGFKHEDIYYFNDEGHAVAL